MMKIFKPTTKAYFVIGVMVMLLILPSVFANTRIILDVSDNIFQRVKVGNGNIYPLTNDGIQDAIYSCNNLSNKVTLSANDGTAIAVTTTIIVSRNVQLDLNGATLKPSAGVDCIRMKEGARIYGGVIDLSNYALNDSTHTAILFDGDDVISYDQTAVSDLLIQGGANQYGTRGIGIYIKSDGESNDLEYTMFLKFNTLTLNYLYYGIKILSENGSPSYHHFNNGHTFSDIHINACQYGIHMQGERNTSCGLTGNYFNNIIVEQGKYSKSFFFVNATYCAFNNIMCYDWNNSGWQTGYTMFEFGNRSEQNILYWSSLHANYSGTRFYIDRSTNKRNTVVGSYTGYLIGITKINSRDQGLFLCSSPTTGQDIFLFSSQSTSLAPRNVYLYGNSSVKYMQLGHSWSNGAKSIQSVISNTQNMRLRVDASGDQYTTGKNVSLFGQYGLTIGARCDSTGSASGKTTGSVSIPLLKLGINTTVPVIANPETGMIRFCSNNNTLAVYSGTRWYFYAPIT